MDFYPQENNQISKCRSLYSSYCLVKARPLGDLQESADIVASMEERAKKTLTYLPYEKFIRSVSYQKGRISRWWAASGQRSRICSGGSEPPGRPVGGRWVEKRGPLDPPGAQAEWEEMTRAAGCQAWKDTRPCWRLARPGCDGCYCAPEGRRQVC